MNNFFLDLSNKFKKMGMNGKDLDHMLASLDWKEKERKSDGTIVYECEIQKGVINE